VLGAQSIGLQQWSAPLVADSFRRRF